MEDISGLRAGSGEQGIEMGDSMLIRLSDAFRWGRFTLCLRNFKYLSGFFFPKFSLKNVAQNVDLLSIAQKMVSDYFFLLRI